MDFHKELNPKIWENEELKSEVKDKLKEIADAFIEYLDIPKESIEDIVITGSCASYNYTKYSDIDLHLLVNFDKVHKECPVVEGYLLSRKSEFNNNHDILIYGIPVEVYAESINNENVHNGLYSLKQDKWIDFPKKLEPTDNDAAVQAKYLELKQETELCDDSEVAVELIDKIKKMRKSGLAKGGEFSTENLAFKKLRDNGIIGKLMEIKKKGIDKQLSLESYQLQERDKSDYLTTEDNESELRKFSKLHANLIKLKEGQIIYDLSDTYANKDESLSYNNNITQIQKNVKSEYNEKVQLPCDAEIVKQKYINGEISAQELEELLPNLTSVETTSLAIAKYNKEHGIEDAFDNLLNEDYTDLLSITENVKNLYRFDGPQNFMLIHFEDNGEVDYCVVHSKKGNKPVMKLIHPYYTDGPKMLDDMHEEPLWNVHETYKEYIERVAKHYGIEVNLENKDKQLVYNEEVEKTKNYTRTRLCSPKTCKKGSFRTKTVNDKGDKIVLCQDKETGKMKAQSKLIKENMEEVANIYGIEFSEFNKNHRWNSEDEIPEEWKEFIEDSGSTFYRAKRFLEESYGLAIVMIGDEIQSGYINFKVYNRPYASTTSTNVMEITRSELTELNYREVAEKILKEINERNPQVLVKNEDIKTLTSKIDNVNKDLEKMLKDLKEPIEEDYKEHIYKPSLILKAYNLETNWYKALGLKDNEQAEDIMLFIIENDEIKETKNVNRKELPKYKSKDNEYALWRDRDSGDVITDYTLISAKELVEKHQPSLIENLNSIVNEALTEPIEIGTRVGTPDGKEVGTVKGVNVADKKVVVDIDVPSGQPKKEKEFKNDELDNIIKEDLEDYDDYEDLEDDEPQETTVTVYNVQWDAEDEDITELPTKFEITFEHYPNGDFDEEVSDAISEKYGFTHLGFNWTFDDYDLQEDVKSLTDKVDKAENELKSIKDLLKTNEAEATIGALEENGLNVDKLIHAAQLVSYEFVDQARKMTPTALLKHLKMRKLSNNYAIDRNKGAIDLVKEWLGIKE